VHEVLFPFARTRLREYLRDDRHAGVLREIVAALRAEHAEDVVSGTRPPLWMDASRDQVFDSVEAYCLWLMDRDRKSPGLKTLQGLIWERGYQAGDLRGQVFPDVARGIRRWRRAGIDVSIYSSGSVLAQRRLFESTVEGDLTPLLTAFFDTSAGAKTSAESYRRIANALGRKPAQVLFISDVTTELTAARTAGLQVLLSMRAGNPPQTDADQFDAIRSFDELSEDAFRRWSPGPSGPGRVTS